MTLLFTTNIFATEVDSYTGTQNGIENSLTTLNKLTNEWLDQTAKSMPLGCSQPGLVKNVAKKFSQWGWSKFEIEISNSDKFKKILPIKNNIYQDFSNSIAGAGVKSFLSPLFNVDGNFIGADKFSHFFNEGFNYYKKVNWQDQTLQDAFAYGEWMENGLWGKLSMGVYSYADLAANYSGYLFFSELSQGERPFFKCQNNTWIKVRNFTFMDFVDPSWDERINCNGFRTQKLEGLYLKRIMELELNHNENYLCPIDQNKCNLIGQKYSMRNQHLLSSNCR